jgi:hypothetical protein
MKFLLFAISFFSLLLTTSSQATTPLDHLSPVEQHEQLNRIKCAREVRKAVNTHQSVLESSIKQLHEANDDERDGHAIIGRYLTREVTKKNVDCGARLKKLILTNETGKQTEVIAIDWEVWERYQRGEITRTKWLKEFSTAIENKILSCKYCLY